MMAVVVVIVWLRWGLVALGCHPVDWASLSLKPLER